jgi:hypothetical protein
MGVFAALRADTQSYERQMAKSLRDFAQATPDGVPKPPTEQRDLGMDIKLRLGKGKR